MYRDGYSYDGFSYYDYNCEYGFSYNDHGFSYIDYNDNHGLSYSHSRLIYSSLLLFLSRTPLTSFFCRRSENPFCFKDSTDSGISDDVTEISDRLTMEVELEGW